MAGSLPDCLDAILALTDPRGLDLILLIYTGRFLDAPLPPTESHVEEAPRIGASYATDGRITGVIAHGTQQDGAYAFDVLLAPGETLTLDVGMAFKRDE